MRRAVVVAFIIAYATAARIPLSDKALPLLSADATLRWDSAAMLDAMQVRLFDANDATNATDATTQGAAMVEVSPRGLRFISPDRIPSLRASTLVASCVAERGSMCAMSEGLFLPSVANYSYVIGRPKSAVLRAFADASETACGYNGGGRTLMSTANYTVSGCDVLQGRFVAVYAFDEVRLFRQTLGPMAYTAAILLQAALACLYFGTIADSSSSSAILVAATLSIALLFVRVPFHTMEDELHFWASIAVTLGMTLAQKNDACVFALAALADAVYRTPENPYAAILCMMLSIRQWASVMRIAASTSRSGVDAADLVITTLYLCITVDTGLVPQFTHPEDWPIYGGAGVYVAFAAAWYKAANETKR